MLTRYIFSLCLAVAGVAQTIVVPWARASADAPGGGGIAGLSQRFRMQVLLEPGPLAAASQHNITGIALRRDGQNLAAMIGGRCDLVVTLSTVSRPARDASTVFANNRSPNAREVFRGQVVIPNAPQLAHRDGATWSSPHAIDVPFITPFFYDGLTLCIDIEGAPVAGSASPWWRVDFELMSHDAQVVTIGASCDPRSKAAASRNTLLPGGSVDLLCSGPSGAGGILILGTSVVSPGIELSFLRAPGCFVHVLPGITMGGVFRTIRPADYGDVGVMVHIPTSSAFLRAMLATQWIVFPSPINQGALSTTNALELQLASAAANLPGVLVRSGPLTASEPMPSSGRVFPNLMPVLQLSYR